MSGFGLIAKKRGVVVFNFFSQIFGKFEEEIFNCTILRNRFVRSITILSIDIRNIIKTQKTFYGF